MVRKSDPTRAEKFLAAALEMFVAQGVQNTSTAEIAKAAGSAAGTLFLYFPTKQELINQLTLKIAREQAAAINALLSPSLTARESFLTIWNGSTDWFREHLDAYLYVRQVRDSGMLPETVVAASNGYFAYYYAAIQKGHAEGSIKPYPVELIGGMLYQQIVAVMELVRANPDAEQQQAYVTQGFEIFWDGIKKV